MSTLSKSCVLLFLKICSEHNWSNWMAKNVGSDKMILHNYQIISSHPLLVACEENTKTVNNKTICCIVMIWKWQWQTDTTVNIVFADFFLYFYNDYHSWFFRTGQTLDDLNFSDRKVQYPVSLSLTCLKQKTRVYLEEDSLKMHYFISWFTVNYDYKEESVLMRLTERFIDDMMILTIFGES